MASRWASLDSDRTTNRSNNHSNNRGYRNNNHGSNSDHHNNNQRHQQSGKGGGKGKGSNEHHVRDEDIHKKNETVLNSMKPGMRLKVQAANTTQKSSGLVELVPFTPNSLDSGDVSQKKHLIVLDLNGVLVDRKPFNQRSSNKQKNGETFARRPYLNEFLDFCFHFFDVAVWSCGKLMNMELDLFIGRELVAVFHQKDSTSCWPRTSIVSPEKPLFLKELKKLWERIGIDTFNEKNTILLDNHDEKFEGSPAECCLVVPEWKVTMDKAGSDSVLSLQSSSASLKDDLCKRANIDGKAFEKFVADAVSNSSSGNLSAVQVPTFAGDSLDASRAAWGSGGTRNGGAATARGATTATLTGDGGEGGRSNDSVINDFLQSFCSSSVHQQMNPEYADWRRYAHARDSPGPRALPFQRSYLSSHLADRGFFCGEKSDGKRMFLYVRHFKSSPKDTVAYVIDVRGVVIQLHSDFVSQFITSAPLSCFDQNNEVRNSNSIHYEEKGNCVVSMFDGELVTTTNTKQILFLVFDTIFIHGQDVGAIADFAQRMERARHFFKPMPLSSSTSKHQKDNSKGHGLLDIMVHVKTFYPMNELHKLVSFLKPLPGKSDLSEGALFKDKFRECLNDGIVFVPQLRPYYSHNCLKWKPAGCLTIDFSIPEKSVSAILQLYRQSTNGGVGKSKTAVDWSSQNAIPLSLSVGGKKRMAVSELSLKTSKEVEHFCQLFKHAKFASSSSSSHQGHHHNQSTDEVILECVYQQAGSVRDSGLGNTNVGLSQGGWKGIRHREDKGKPNSLSTAWRVMETAIDPLNLDALINFSTEHAHPVSNTTSDQESITALNTQPKPAAWSAPSLHSDTSASAGENAQLDDVKSAVAQHYDEAQRERNEKVFTDDPIEKLRRLNNWSKAVMVGNFVVPALQTVANNVMPAKKPSLYLESLTNPCRIVNIPIPPVVVEPKKHMPSKNNSNSRSKNKNSNLLPIRVLELGCGRGGDIRKWDAHPLKIDMYVGVDVSEVALEEASRRVAGGKGHHGKGKGKGGKESKYAFIQGDMSEANMLSQIKAKHDELLKNRKDTGTGGKGERGKGGGKGGGGLVDEIHNNNEGMFDVVAIQFALHYICSDNESITRTMQTVSKCLKTNGKLLVTIVDSRAITEGLSNQLCAKGEGQTDGPLSFGNNVFNIQVENKALVTKLERIHSHYWHRNKEGGHGARESDKLVLSEVDDVWGLKYYFSLGNAVQHCPEFVVPLPALEQVASHNKLKLIHAKQLQQFVVDCCNTSSETSASDAGVDSDECFSSQRNSEFVDLLDVMNVLPNLKKESNRKLTQDEWEAIGVYSVLVFEKC